MSGSSYDDTCFRCDGTMYCYENRKPHDFVSGECLNCGYEYYTVDGHMRGYKPNLRKQGEVKR